jgi:hypothetical protein
MLYNESKHNVLALEGKANKHLFPHSKISKFLIFSIGNLVNFIWGKESVILVTMPQAAT